MTNLLEQIKAAFALDQQRAGEPVFRADQLPLSYESITDEWLTDVLCKDHAGARVVGHRLEGNDDGSSNRRKIAVDYNDVGRSAGLPIALFCKATHSFTYQ